jgi:hypothetical protein
VIEEDASWDALDQGEADEAEELDPGVEEPVPGSVEGSGVEVPP